MGVKYAKCPYWRGESRQVIHCESPIYGAVEMRTGFGEPKKKTEHKKNFCCSLFKSCPIYIENFLVGDNSAD